MGFSHSMLQAIVHLYREHIQSVLMHLAESEQRIIYSTITTTITKLLL